MGQEYDPIAIVGMGMRAPEADDVDTFWKLLEEKRDVTREIPKDRFNTDFWCNKTKFKGSSVGEASLPHFLDFISWRFYRFD